MPDSAGRPRSPTDQGYRTVFPTRLRKDSLNSVFGKIARLGCSGFLSLHPIPPFRFRLPLRGEGRAGKSLGFLVFIFGMSCAAGGFRRILILTFQAQTPPRFAPGLSFSSYFFRLSPFFPGRPPSFPQSRTWRLLYFRALARPPIAATSPILSSLFFGM